MTQGKVTHVSLSGGFWGIVTDSGQQLFPVHGLPAAFQQESLRVLVEFRPSKAATIYMWGQAVTITDIQQA
jgi:hypothetical protein